MHTSQVGRGRVDDLQEEGEEADVAQLVDVLRDRLLQHPPRHLGPGSVRAVLPRGPSRCDVHTDGEGISVWFDLPRFMRVHLVILSFLTEERLKSRLYK